MEHVPCSGRPGAQAGPSLTLKPRRHPAPHQRLPPSPHHITALHRRPHGLKEQILQDHTAQLRFRFLSKNKWG